MTEYRYFYLVKPLWVLLDAQQDDSEPFQLDGNKYGEIVDQRRSATGLPGWVVIRIVPNNIYWVKRSELESRVNWMTAVQYQLAVSKKQILKSTWLDRDGVKFELNHSLEVHQWVPRVGDPEASLIPVFLPKGTVGEIKTLSWDFEDSEDKQYWMMEIETTNGRCYDVMYPELLAASVEYRR